MALSAQLGEAKMVAESIRNHRDGHAGQSRRRILDHRRSPGSDREDTRRESQAFETPPTRRRPDARSPKVLNAKITLDAKLEA